MERSFIAAHLLAAFLAVATNASVEDLNVELAFDTSEDADEHDYFQQYVATERGMPRSMRVAHPEAIQALVTGVNSHGRRERLFRAIDQYRIALSHWRQGYEALAVAHLFMAAESLQEIVLDDHLDRQAISRYEAFRRWNDLPSDHELDEKDIRAIGSDARLHLIFEGDRDCYRDAQAARNGFQHGYMAFDDVRAHASQARDKTARYVRQAIIRSAGLSVELEAVLSGPPYHLPFASFPLVRYIRGTLVGPADQLAAAGQHYPYFRWAASLREFEFNAATREYEITPNEKLTAMFGSGVTFRPSRMEVWGPRTKDDQVPANLTVPPPH